jgi:hypothetical protein
LPGHGLTSWSRAQAKLHPDLTEYERPSGSVEEGAVELKSAEQILESIFGPTPQASPMEQAERTLRRPKRVVYTAMSNRNFHWRMHVTKFVLDEGCVPVNPFMLFDYYLLHTVNKETVREAMNNLLVKCDECWVFGQMSLGVKVQVGIAKRLKKPIRFYDIADLPERIVRISENLAEEEARD